MANQDLKAKLVELRQRLQKAVNINPADRDLWTTLITELSRQAEAETDKPDHSPQDLRAALEQKGAAYEIEHPEIAYIVRQVLDILVKMGI
ncbi:MAG: DUF4404 family protein [Porticoccaceae bacterium]|jgi:hypothetical protein|nr:DUF4404 family protein [Porticoccaceae bacterium]MBT5577127.1 DUF4404 family protein [Porticoccaceae bacterium]MBT7375297.1 DUF4404 family protein [Porticoccaceae bacterium]